MDFCSDIAILEALSSNSHVLIAIPIDKAYC